MTATYDAIVVGARCAGSSTAMLLARKGYRVLLVDKAAFPSDTLSNHFLHQPGGATLQRWGLLDRVLAAGTPPVTQVSFDLGPFALRGAPPPAGDIESAYAPRRTVLDTILLDAAMEAGVEVRERFSVKELVSDGDRVAGIRGRAEGGSLVTERARIVIGADGMRSGVARMVGAPTYDERPAFNCAYYSYWSGMPIEIVEFYVRPERVIIASPTNDGLTTIIVYWPVRAFDEVRSDIERHFLAALDLAPALAERVRAASRVEKFRGSAELGGFFRRPYGPGWALVGDAAYHKNPITAQGMTDAFRHAELLAHAIDDAFAGRRPEDAALAGYEEARNAAVMPMYMMTADLAKLEPPSAETQALMEALRGNEEQIGRFLGTVSGTTPIPEFFSPENLGRIMGVGAPA